MLLQVCETCGRQARSWWSTERSGQVSVFDTLWASAMVVSGNHQDKISHMMEYANMGTISKSAFNRIANNVLQPLVKDTVEGVLDENRRAALAASPDGLILSGMYTSLSRN